MLEVSNVKVYDLEECIVASGYAMRTKPYDYLEESVDGHLDHHIERCKKLVRASKNSDVHCHDNFLTGIRVSFDIKYPQYWSPEAQRYHFFDIVTSQSKMHRLIRMDLDKACNKYVTKETKANLEKYIFEYNTVANITDSEDLVVQLNLENERYIRWMKVISNCPMGLELTMRVSTNYKQLQTMYYQRRHHKLKEDWQEGFCRNFIEKLPYFKELILGEYEEDSNS